MPKTTYYPDGSYPITVVDVGQPVDERAAILDDMVHGGPRNYDHGPLGYSPTVTGLYEVQADNGFNTSIEGYLLASIPPAPSAGKSKSWLGRIITRNEPNDDLIIKAGAVNARQRPNVCQLLSATLLFSMIRQQEPQQKIIVSAETELPINASFGRQPVMVESLRQELLEQYPWLSSATVENIPRKYIVRTHKQVTAIRQY